MPTWQVLLVAVCSCVWGSAVRADYREVPVGNGGTISGVVPVATASRPVDTSSPAAHDDHSAPTVALAAHPESPRGTSEEILVPPQPLSEETFPCMDCHAEGEPNPTRRVLTEYHEELELRHDEQNRWCLDCHDERDRDQLRLASGALVPFERSYLLCGQCHGPSLRSWKAGVHGKRTGRWDGGQRYSLLCVHCHNPHQPRFPHLRPMPKPVAPDELRASLARSVPPLVFETGPPFAAPHDESEDEESAGKVSVDGNDAQ